MKKKLTQRTCEAATVEDGPFIWDTELTNFALRIAPGGTKSFIIQYRAGYGRAGSTRRMTIGRYGDGVWTVEKARQEARRLLGEAATGGDPLKAKQTDRDELRVNDLLDLYFAEGCATNKAITLKRDIARAKSHVRPLIGKVRLSEMTRAKVEKMMRDIADGKTAAKTIPTPRPAGIVKGGKSTANRTAAMLQGAFTFAISRELIGFNPVTGVKRYTESKNERFLDTVELQGLGDALAKVEDEGANPMAISIIRLLCFTGARRNEIESLKWSDVDIERGLIFLGDSKTGKKAFPLAPAAVLILSETPRTFGSLFVFPSSRGDSYYVGVRKVWDKVRGLANLKDVRMHDLRHTFASVGAGGGFSLPIIGKILGHKSSATTQRYAHLADDPVKRAAKRIGDTISAHMTRKHNG